MGKFDYAPGLPGYGTRGIDGSTGLTGLATYFSSYDGTTDSITIKSKIVSNKILFPTDELLPGYPGRVYQTGDTFIDKNGRVFQIDFDEVDLYTNTGQQLNTSGFFESGPNTVQTPIYERYSNAFTTSKFLIDIVYETTGSIGNYAANPGSGDSSIYGIRAVDFAQVKYVDNAIGSYHPFTVWTNSTDTNDADQAIALVKADNSTNWRFGNAVTDGTPRSGVDLYLDFDTVYGTFSGTINATNLYLPGWLKVDMDVSFGSDVYIGGTLYGGSPIAVGDDLNFLQDSSIKIDGDLMIHTEDDNPPGEIFILTGSATSTTRGGDIVLSTGNGGDYTGGYSAGSLEFEGGTGGNGSTNSGGRGGSVRFQGGAAGQASGSTASDLYGGSGGTISLFGGLGGAVNNSGPGDEYGGDGGDVSIRGGVGNSNASAFVGGQGGTIYIDGGKGGDGGYSDGIGGAVLINGGLNYLGSTQNLVRIQQQGGRTYFHGDTFHYDQILGSSSATSTAPSFSFNNDTNLGIYRDSADVMAFAMSGGGRFFFEYSSDAPHSANDPHIRSNDNLVLYPNPTTTGESIIIKGGPATVAGNKSHVFIEGGDAITSGTGGDVSIASGSGPSRSGDVNIYTPGDGTDSGGINIMTNQAADVGSINIWTYGPTGNTLDAGGDINIFTLSPTATAPPGQIYLNSAGNIVFSKGTGYDYDFNGVTTGVSQTGRYGLQISSTGIMTAAASGTSDIRFKNIDASIIDPISKIAQLTGIEFRWNELAEEITSQPEGQSTYGLIAQEVQPLFPYMVDSWEVDGVEYLNLDYEKFVPVFVEAFKEQKKEIDDLKIIISDLTSRIEALENV